MGHCLSYRSGVRDGLMEGHKARALRRPLGDESKPTETGLLLLPNFSLLGVIAAIDVMRHANRLSGRDLYVSRVYSPDALAVRASNGLVLSVEGMPGPELAPDFLFGCGWLHSAPLQKPAVV